MTPAVAFNWIFWLKSVSRISTRMEYEFPAALAGILLVRLKVELKTTHFESKVITFKINLNYFNINQYNIYHYYY